MSRSQRPLSPLSLSRELLRDPQSSLPSFAAELQRASPTLFQERQALYGLALRLAADQSPWISAQLAQEWLRSTDSRLRVLAADALPLFQEVQIAKHKTLIEAALNDPAAPVRATAISRLASSTQIDTALLDRLAADPQLEVRIALARALRRAALTDGAFPALEKLLEDPDPELTWAAGEALEASAQKNLQRSWELISRSAALGSEQRRLALARSAIEGVLALAFENLAPTIRAWLKTAPTPARWTLAQSLARCPYSPRLIQILTQLSTDPAAEVRRLIAKTILRIAPRLAPNEAEALLSRGEADSDLQTRAAFQSARQAFASARQQNDLSSEDPSNDETEDNDDDIND